jgi:hypothetical protein
MNPALTLISCFLNAYKSSVKNLEVNNFGNLILDGIIILRWTLNTQGVSVCGGFICLGTGSSDRLFWTRHVTAPVPSKYELVKKFTDWRVLKNYSTFDVSLFPFCYLTTLSVSRLYSAGDGMVNEYGALGGMRTSRGNRSTRIKLPPVPQCSPQIPYELTWDRTRAAAVEAADWQSELWHGLLEVK